MKTSGSYKVVFDAAGAPWLVVGCGDGTYEAQRLLVIDRRLFPRSWQAKAPTELTVPSTGIPLFPTDTSPSGTSTRTLILK